jgi:hypothetical protein
MKNIIIKTWLILTLSFFGLANVNANSALIIGKYTEADDFTATYYLKKVNPNAPFNFAVKVEDDAMKMLLSAEEGRTLALTSLRYADSAGVVTNFTHHEIRLIPKGNYVYVLENYDAVGENPLEIGLSGHLHTGFLVTGEDFWWNQNIMSGVTPADNYLYIGLFEVTDSSQTAE